MNKECNICCETINKSLRREVKCPYCDFITCAVCFRRYLIDSTKHADCMNCHTSLSLEFIATVTSKTFYEVEYRNKRANDLLSLERSLLPDTQHLVEDAMIRKKREQYIAELLDEEKYLKLRIKEIRKEVSDLRHVYNYDDEEKTDPKERKKFIMKCQVDDCRGFLSQAWKCGTCGMYACSKCRAVKNERDDKEHKCNPDDVATAQLIKQETKPCPKCAVPIYKIDGCDQMYCTNSGCHTAFSWNTGKIETGKIHNPHYYEWQRSQNNGVAPRVPGDEVCCGDLPWMQTVYHIAKQRKQKFQYIDNCHRIIEHVRQIILPQYPIAIGMQDNTDLRVKYLTNDIDDKKWLQQLKMRQKKVEKDRDVNQVLDMFINTLTDLFNMYVRGDSWNLEKDAETLRTYVNSNLHKIAKQYNNKTPFITPQWNIV